MSTAAREDTPLPGRLIQKNAFVTIALILFSLCPAAAQQQDCMASYYRSKSPACVDEVIAQLRRTQGSRSEPSALIGFLAQLFRDSLSERERILKGDSSDYVKSVDLVILHRAGLADEAQKFAAANNLAAANDKLRAARLVPLDALQPSSVPGDNDLLIGAYMASGNAAFLQKILSNYASADDDMTSDALRIGFMNGKFGPTLAPKGREPAIMQAACAKYQCKTDPAKLLRIMTLSSAIWALQSLAAKDDGVKKALADFFEGDARLKNLYTAERTAFGNYLTTIVAVTALKNDQRSADQEQVFAAMSKSASIYENLGSPAEAFAPMTSLKQK
jgi:hypothetical protein